MDNYLLYKTLSITPMVDDTIVLNKPFVYKDITVPEGFVSDGITMPKYLRPLLSMFSVSRFKPSYLPAVVIHDYLCDLEMYEKADKYFEEILYSVEKTVVTKSMVLAVKEYHKFRYNTK